MNASAQSDTATPNPRLIAFYLPQFHPVFENDRWWSPGFTEWTNLSKARPLYKGHEQPKIPGELGFYDLRLSETREKQADLARQYGIEGFCYWHYWFGYGRQLLERPFNEVLESGSPNFPFCLAWANEPWRGFDHGIKTKVPLIEQFYPGEDDDRAHFQALLPAFKDPRYITVDSGKPVFLIYHPLDNIAAIKAKVALWRRLAKEAGLPGIHFVGISFFPEKESRLMLEEVGMDAINECRFHDYKTHPECGYRMASLRSRLTHTPLRIDYTKASETMLTPSIKSENVYPTIYSNWDHTPRSGRRGLIFENSMPEKFGKILKRGVEMIAHKPADRQLLFLKSWNEWGEGNYLEPDQKNGRAMLRQIADVVKATPPTSHKVSVLIAAYGQEKYLAETLKSLQAQTYTNWEAIIVDDGSPDNVAAVARQWESADERIHFFHTENRGVSAARNFAATKATGEFVMSLDGDDLIAPEYIATCVDILTQRPEVKVVFTQWKGFGYKRRVAPLFYYDYNNLLFCNAIYVSGMVRMADFKAIGGFDENMKVGHEDWEFWIRLLQGTTPRAVFMHPKPYFLYRQKKNSRNTNAEQYANSIGTRTYIWEKHKDKYNALGLKNLRSDLIFAGTYGNFVILNTDFDILPQADRLNRFHDIVTLAKNTARRTDMALADIQNIVKLAVAALEPAYPTLKDSLRPKDRKRFLLMQQSPDKFIRRVRLENAFRRLTHPH